MPAGTVNIVMTPAGTVNIITSTMTIQFLQTSTQASSDLAAAAAAKISTSQSPLTTQAVPICTNTFGAASATPDPKMHQGTCNEPIACKIYRDRHCSSSNSLRRTPTKESPPKYDGSKLPDFNNDDESRSMPEENAPSRDPHFTLDRKEIQAESSKTGGEASLSSMDLLLMPKLSLAADYYTEPPIQEVATKEKSEPGFCRHVKDFVIGRHGYGSIKLIGETDVVGLDLESLVRFNNREVVFNYKNDRKKTPLLPRLAEVTLLNVMCFDKKTGQCYVEGPKVDKYKKMLMNKAQEQDAEYMSYDPCTGEWKFRVKDLNKYNNK